MHYTTLKISILFTQKITILGGMRRNTKRHFVHS